jgi:D-xylose transport system substrate-binding protein
MEMFDRITVRRRLTKGLATLSVIGLMTTAAACGSDDGNSDQNSGGDKASGKVFFLVPNATTPAWPTYYMPAVEKAVEEMLPDVELVTESADNDPAKQLSQVEAAIAQQAAAVIISPPNPAQAGAALAKLAAADIPAIGYLNDPNGGPVNSYVWVDFATIGEYWGQWLRDNLEKEVGHSPVRLAAIYGDPTFKVYDLWLEGIKPELDALVDEGKVEIVCQADTPGWDPAVAQKAMEQCLTSTDNNVDVTLAMNDSTSDGIWAALKAQGLNGKVIMAGGHDGSLTAIQRILVGDQVGTFHPDGEQLGQAAASLVQAALEGESADSTGFINGTFDNGFVDGGVPTVFGKENLVTADTVQQEIVDNGIFTKDDICEGIAAQSDFCTS